MLAASTRRRGRRDRRGGVATAASAGGTTRPGSRHVLTGRVLRILVAECPGCVELGRSLGLPMVHVDAVVDPAAAIRSLNARAHGPDAARGHPRRPSPSEAGWRDWIEIARPRGDPPPEEADGREGVIRVGPRLEVVLPSDAILEDFRMRLRASLRHLSLREALGDRPLRTWRSGDAGGRGAPERCRRDGRADRFEGVGMVDDLYVLDPVAGSGGLFWKVVAARRAAIFPPGT